MTEDATITGYADAQARLRAKTGRELCFYTPVAETWPPGTPLDAHGKPIDPSVEPEQSGFEGKPILCNVASRPVRGAIGSGATDSPVGLIGSSSLVLITDPELYATVEDATECVVFGHRYKIEDAKPDQLGGDKVQRMLIFVEKK